LILVAIPRLGAGTVRNSQLSLAKFGWGFLFSAEWKSGHPNPTVALSSVYGTLVSTIIGDGPRGAAEQWSIALFQVELGRRRSSARSSATPSSC
jgi:hypothetical protein